MRGTQFWWSVRLASATTRNGRELRDNVHNKFSNIQNMNDK